MALSAALGIVSGAGQIYGGYSAYKSGKKQASLLRKQGELAYQEAMRDAALIMDEGIRFQHQQEFAYISSGVQIEGTPLLVMAETERMAATEAKYTQEMGEAKKELYYQQAKIAKSEGKAQLISSIFSGGASAIKGFQ